MWTQLIVLFTCGLLALFVDRCLNHLQSKSSSNSRSTVLQKIYKLARALPMLQYLSAFGGRRSLSSSPRPITPSHTNFTSLLPDCLASRSSSSSSSSSSKLPSNNITATITMACSPSLPQGSKLCHTANGLDEVSSTHSTNAAGNDDSSASLSRWASTAEESLGQQCTGSSASTMLARRASAIRSCSRALSLIGSELSVPSHNTTSHQQHAAAQADCASQFVQSQHSSFLGSSAFSEPLLAALQFDPLTSVGTSASPCASPTPYTTHSVSPTQVGTQRSANEAGARYPCPTKAAASVHLTAATAPASAVPHSVSACTLSAPQRQATDAADAAHAASPQGPTTPHAVFSAPQTRLRIDSVGNLLCSGPHLQVCSVPSVLSPTSSRALGMILPDQHHDNSKGNSPELLSTESNASVRSSAAAPAVLSGRRISCSSTAAQMAAAAAAAAAVARSASMHPQPHAGGIFPMPSVLHAHLAAAPAAAADAAVGLVHKQLQPLRMPRSSADFTAETGSAPAAITLTRGSAWPPAKASPFANHSGNSTQQQQASPYSPCRSGPVAHNALYTAYGEDPATIHSSSSNVQYSAPGNLGHGMHSAAVAGGHGVAWPGVGMGGCERSGSRVAPTLSYRGRTRQHAFTVKVPSHPRRHEEYAAQVRERVLARAMGLASPEAAPIGGSATFYGCVQLLAWVLTAQPQDTQATPTAIPAPRAAHAGAAPSFGTRNLGTANGSDAFAAACMGSLPDADVLQCVSMQIGSRLHAWQAGDEHAASFTNSTVQLQAGASQSVQLQCLGPWVPVVDSAQSADSAAVRHADSAAPSGAQPEQATVEICLTSVQDTKVRLILVRDGVLLVDCTAELVQGMQVLDLPVPVQAHVGILQLAVMPLPTSQGTAATASHPTSSSMPLMYDSCMLLALPAAACNDLTSLLAAHMQHCQHQQRSAVFPMHGMAACRMHQEATILDAAAWACAQLQPLLCDFGYVIEASSIAQEGLSESVASTASATASSLLRYMQDAGLHACASYVVALWGRVNRQALSGTQAATSYAHPTTELPTEPRPWVHLHSMASAGSKVTHTYEEHTQQERLVHAHAEPLLHADPPSAPMPHAEATSDILPCLHGHHAALTQLNGWVTSDMRSGYSAGGGALDTERAGRLEPLTTCISADAAMPTLNVLMAGVPGVSLRVRTSSSSTETRVDSMDRMIELG